jgi:hypothetical protein
MSSSSLDLLGIHVAVLDCIVGLRNLTSMASLETPIPYPSLHIRKYLTERMAVEYRLLQLGVDSHLTEVSRAVCLAAQIYVNRVLRTFERGSLVLHRLAERLRSSIEIIFHEAVSAPVLPSCIVWVAVMGAMGAQDGPLRVWFAALVRSVCYDTGCTEYRVVRSQLQSFLWSHGPLDNDAVLLWRELGET